MSKIDDLYEQEKELATDSELATVQSAVDLNTAKATNVTTDLSLGANNGSTLGINSSDGSDIVLPAAATGVAGLLSGSDKDKMDAISGTNTGDETKISIDALGVNAATVNSLSVETAVPAGALFTDTNTWRTITDSVATTSSTVGASATAVKAAYDRLWATTSHTHSYLPLSGGTVTGITSFTNVTDSTSTTTGAIKTSGGIGAAKSIYAGGNITAYSDKRLKTNIEVIPNALSKVCTLSGYTYDRTDMDLRQTGVIAQEVLEVLPEAVVGSEEEMYGVNYGAMVGLLIESIKELKAEIEELKAK